MTVAEADRLRQAVMMLLDQDRITGPGAVYLDQIIAEMTW